MKSRHPMITVAIALVGVLIVSMGLIALGSRESRAFPAAESYLPSGASAFAELLRQKGYEVVVDSNTRPTFRDGDLVIAFSLSAVKRLGFLTAEADEEQLRNTNTAIANFVKGGGTVLSLPLATDFAEDSRQLYDAELTVYSGSTGQANVSWDELESPDFYLQDGDNFNEIPVWGTISKSETGSKVSKTPFVKQKSVDNGREISFANGIIATNRFIDRAENAKVLISVISNVRAKRIVFAEAAYGNAKDKGLLETIGPWALAAWFQLVFLGIVIIYTLGKPFGLPDPERRQERGARDLMDAMANTLRRGRMTKLALKIVFDDANRFLRKLYRGKRDPSPADLKSSNMGELQNALTTVEAAIEVGAPEDEARKMVQEVERLMREASTRTPSTY